MRLDTPPILFMVFNRPDTTRQVFAAIREARPKHLYVAADGPRIGKEGEQQLCEEVRQIATAVDWDCEVHTLFRAHNLGCGHAPAGAITWFFENVEQGIILEDDCIPDPSFFHYCAELLEQYKDNEQIMHICGNNFLSKNYSSGESYYFNKYFTAWGWATWRRAWQKYDFNVPYLTDLISSGKLEKVALNQRQLTYWINTLKLVENGQRGDIWDYQWILTCWYYDAYAITPVVNLVTNVGFGTDATHTVGESRVSYVKTKQLNTLVHPALIRRNKKVDTKTFEVFFQPSQRLNNIRSIMYAILPKTIMAGFRKLRRKFLPGIK